jgi:hypothetical protein
MEIREGTEKRSHCGVPAWREQQSEARAGCGHQRAEALDRLAAVRAITNDTVELGDDVIDATA